MFAQAHHPAMKHAAPVRRELGTRTVFNVLGPLTNPARARAQVVGVYSPDLVRPVAEALVQLGARRAFVVHGAGGIDELSPVGPNHVSEVVDGGVRDRVIDPEELGIERCELERLAGGTPAENAASIRRVFAGEQRRPARRDPAQRRRRDRRRRAMPPTCAKGSRSRGRRSTRARAAARLDELVEFTRAMRFARRTRRARARRDRRSEAALAVGRRPASRRRSGAARRAVRRAGAAAISVLVDERFAGTIDDLRAARAATDAPLLGKGLLLDGGAPARAEGGRRGRHAADPARPRRRDVRAPARVRARAGHGRARRGARRRRAAARDGARCADDRHQRPRPRNVRHRPAHTAAARRARAERSHRHRRERRAHTRARRRRRARGRRRDPRGLGADAGARSAAKLRDLLLARS